NVSIDYPASEEKRTYGLRSAPLRRVRYDKGERVSGKGGKSFDVAEVTEESGILTYHGEKKQRLIETELVGTGAAQTQPQERLFSGRVDDLRRYRFRLDTLDYRARALQSPVRGFVGPRVNLLPHQLFVASQVALRAAPRALLADEVGLSKTIEAGLVLHRLLVTVRAKKV